MVIHVFQKLISSARPFKKKASSGYCVLVFKSSGEPAALARVSDSCVLGGSGNEFEIRRATSCEEGAAVTMNAQLDHESSMGQFYFCTRQDLSRFTSLCISNPAELSFANFGEGDISTETETKRRREDQGVPGQLDV